MTADITHIKRLIENFKDPENRLSIEMLEQEKKSIATILSVREMLENDLLDRSLTPAMEP